MRILLIEDEDELRELMRMTLVTNCRCAVVEASSGNQAISVLREDRKFDLVISDWKMNNGTGADVFRFVTSEKIDVRFILCTGLEPDPTIFQGPQFVRCLRKPHVIKPLVAIIEEIRTAKPVSEYVGITTANILKVNLTGVELFVRLSDTKFVRVAHAEDAFSEDDVLRYTVKKIDRLYIKRADCVRFAEKLEADLTHLEQAKVGGLDVAFAVSKTAQRTIHEITQQLGFKAEVRKLVEANVKLALRTLATAPRLGELLKKLQEEPEDYLSAHSVAIAHVAGGLAALMGWNSEITYYKLALAAFLHDLPLKDERLARFRLLDEMVTPDGQAVCSYEDITAVREHPEKAASLVREMTASPDVDVILRQHHERPDGGGFPAQLGHAKISPLTAVFIMAEDLVNFSFDRGANFRIEDFLEQEALQFREGHFKKILSALTVSATGT